MFIVIVVAPRFLTANIYPLLLSLVSLILAIVFRISPNRSSPQPLTTSISVTRAFVLRSSVKLGEHPDGEEDREHSDGRFQHWAFTSGSCSEEA